MEDEELIQEVLNGNTRYYAQIVERYQQVVANLCYKLCGNKLDVEEVTQQVFCSLYTALPRFRFQSKLSTFIYRITVNVVGKQLKIQRRVVPQSQLPNLPDQGHNDNAEQQIVRSERDAMLHRCIDQLKEEQRTALVLYSFEEFSYKEIDVIMQISLAKVETLIFRARKNLKVMIENTNWK